jgi:hypothetical protein
VWDSLQLEDFIGVKWMFQAKETRVSLRIHEPFAQTTARFFRIHGDRPLRWSVSTTKYNLTIYEKVLESRDFGAGGGFGLPVVPRREAQ